MYSLKKCEDLWSLAKEMFGYENRTTGILSYRFSTSTRVFFMKILYYMQCPSY